MKFKMSSICAPFHTSALSPGCSWRSYRRHIQGLFLYWSALCGCHIHSMTSHMVLHCGQAHFLTPPIITIAGSSDPCSFFISEGDGIGSLSPTSMGDGGGGSVVTISIDLPLSCRRSCGKSPGPASSTTSSNNFHPSVTVLCPSATI